MCQIYQTTQLFTNIYRYIRRYFTQYTHLQSMLFQNSDSAVEAGASFEIMISAALKIIHMRVLGIA